MIAKTKTRRQRHRSKGFENWGRTRGLLGLVGVGIIAAGQQQARWVCGGRAAVPENVDSAMCR